MEQKSIKRPGTVMTVMLFIIVIAGAGYIASRIPMQELKITAQTTAEEFDMTGATDLYYLKPLKASESYNVIIKFMAVKNTSKNLFTSRGTGQYVRLGCDDLHADYRFISFGSFLHIRLTLKMAQTDLKLEDGTPFDITRYSLKPVLVIEK